MSYKSGHDEDLGFLLQYNWTGILHPPNPVMVYLLVVTPGRLTIGSGIQYLPIFSEEILAPNKAKNLSSDILIHVKTKAQILC